MDKYKKNRLITVAIVVVIIVCLLLAGVIFFVYKAVESANSDRVHNLAVSKTITSSSSKDKKLNIYFVRHGKTDANVRNIFAGRKTEAKLTEEGQEATKKTGKALKNVKFVSAFTSELKRTKDTADIILAENNNETPKPISMSLLNDIDWGDIEGKAHEEVAKLYPGFTEEFFLGDLYNKSFVSPIHATSKYRMVNQFYTAIKEIYEKTPDDGNVLVVGHSSFVWLLDALFPDEMKDTAGLDNSAITVLSIDKGKLSLKHLNMDADKFNES